MRPTNSLPGLALSGTKLPTPRFSLESVYEEGEQRRRAVALSPALLTEHQALLNRIGWPSGEETAAKYSPIIAQYWHFCEVNGLERYDLLSLAHYVYLLAYPRLIYLNSTPDHERRGSRHEPGVGRGSLQVFVAAITRSFTVTGRPAPSSHAEWKEWFRGLNRRLAERKDRKEPAMREDLCAAVDAALEDPNERRGRRDAALLLLGWSCALRRSNLCAVTVEAIKRGSEGAQVFLPQSKTDPMGAGRFIPLYRAKDERYDALTAIDRWLAIAQIDKGWIFREIDRHGNVGAGPLDPRQVVRIMQRRGLRGNIGSHSLRIGYVTQGVSDGKQKAAIRMVTLHTNDVMIDAYTRFSDMNVAGPGSLL